MMFIRIRFGIAVTSSPVGCPLQTFLIFLLPLFIAVMLVLASIDRFIVSSPLVRIRNRSQVRVTKRIILTTVILSILYAIPFLFIYHFDGNTEQCVSYSSTIAVVYLSSRIVLLYIIIPFAMTIFGFLTIRNIKNQSQRVASVTANLQRQNRHRRTEGQLARMLIIQVGVYLIFSTPAGIAYTLVTFVTSMNTTFMIQLRIIFSLGQQSIYFLSFFLYMLSSNVYRQELNQIFKIHQLRNQFSHYIVQFIRRYIATNNAINTDV